MMGNKLEAAFSRGAAAQGLAGHKSAVGDWLLLQHLWAFFSPFTYLTIFILTHKFSHFWSFQFSPSSCWEGVNEWLGRGFLLPASQGPPCTAVPVSAQLHGQWPQDGTWTLCLDSRAVSSARGACPGPDTWAAAAPKACPLPSEAAQLPCASTLHPPKPTATETVTCLAKSRFIENWRNKILLCQDHNHP